MKRTFFSYLIAGAFAFIACTSNTSTTPKKQSAAPVKDTAHMSAMNDTTEPKQITPTLANVDPKVSASLDGIVDNYLQLKNALANDDASAAATSAKSIMAGMSKVDVAALTPDQKKVYSNIADDLKENAEHISKNAGKIAHQREHFAMMSDDVFDLVKGFGAAKPLYQDHCPMAQEGKGADWLSETKEIHNPYLGKKMPDCGSVEAVVKK